MSIYPVGFTGTRQGMTEAQSEVMRGLLRGLRWDATVHHGACVGADAQLNDMAIELGFRTYAHPASDVGPELVAQVMATHTYEAQPALVRDRVIVDTTVELFAAPKTMAEHRSGTWATVNYARQHGRTVTVVWPSGAVTVEHAGVVLERIEPMR